MLIYQQNLHWLNLRQISGLVHKVRFSSCQEQYEELPAAGKDVFAEVPASILWPKLIIGKANNDDLDYNFALTVVQELAASYDASMAFVCCAPDNGLPRNKALSGQSGFLEELFYRTDLACHAGHGCGGTLSDRCGGTLSFPGVSIFREGVSKGYKLRDVAHMHLVLAQHSFSSRGGTGGIKDQRTIAQITYFGFESCTQRERSHIGHLRQLYLSSGRRNLEHSILCRAVEGGIDCGHDAKRRRSVPLYSHCSGVIAAKRHLPSLFREVGEEEPDLGSDTNGFSWCSFSH